MATLIKHASLFRNKDFLILWGNQLLLQIAFNLSNYTALLILANHFHSPLVQAKFFVALTIPAFLFGFIAGPIIDLVNRKALLLIADFLLGLFLLLYLFAGADSTFFMAIAFLTSSVARFFVPAQFASLPFIVEEKDLETANAFFLFTLLGSVLVGYGAAGPIMQLFGGLGTKGEVAPFFVSSCMLFVGYFLLLFLTNIETPKVALEATSFVRQIMKLCSQTFTAIRKDVYLPFSLLLLVFVELLIGFLSVIVLEYVRQYLLLPLTAVSYVFLVPLMIGLVIGISILKFVEKKVSYYTSIGVSCLTIGLLLFSLGVLPQLIDAYETIRIIAIVSALCIGTVFVLITVQSRTLLQLHAPKNMQGRIFSFLDILIAFATPLPVLLLGFVADASNILTTLVLFGAFIICTTVVGSRVIK